MSRRSFECSIANILLYASRTLQKQKLWLLMYAQNVKKRDVTSSFSNDGSRGKALQHFSDEVGGSGKVAKHDLVVAPCTVARLLCHSLRNKFQIVGEYDFI